MDDKSGHSGRAIAALAREFLADIRSRRYSPRTVEVYGQAVRDFGRFLHARRVERVQAVGRTLTAFPARTSSTKIFGTASKLTGNCT